MQAPAFRQDLEITGLTADSRMVEPGFLFAAFPGSATDGRIFIPQAIERGAAAVLAPEGSALPETLSHDVALITDANPRRRLARLAAAFHGAAPANIAAITGTSGKTSVADFCRQIWQMQGLSAASLGTLGLLPAREGAPKSLTTPDPVELHACLSLLKAEGVDHLALEASSHGLDQYRLDGLRPRAALFTNLSQDHLDYHSNMGSYLAAKARLFSEILVDDGTAILNADAPEFEELAGIVKARGLKLVTFGRKGKDYRILDRKPHPDGQLLRFAALGENHEVKLGLIGLFQAENVLGALALAIACGADAKRAIADLPRLQGVPGRMELAAQTENGASIYVDYAHKPGALETVLDVIRPHTEGKLWVVFGCGGDRDRGKRPQMGEIAVRLADHTVVTDDNPRSDDPAAIRREILAAAPGAIEIGDRGKAIAFAVAQLGPGDVLVVAGKGHESGQIVGDKILPFDDKEESRVAAALPGAAFPGEKP